MPETLTLGRLLELHGPRLGLEIQSQRPVSGTDPLAARVSGSDGTSLVGHMNLIRPNRMQVLGAAELGYLNGLDPLTTRTLVGQLVGNHPACVIVADGLEVPQELVTACAETSVVLLRAAAPSQRVVQELAYFLARSTARRASLHGVFIEVMGVGVLLTGQAGVGKSELALELVSRGHRLIADDAPEISLVAPDTVEGSCPPALRDFMEVRGLGIINVRALFGDSAVKPRRSLRLVIHLAVMEGRSYSAEERLQGIRGTLDILGVAVPQVSLPVAPGHNMAVLVECTVRNHILGMKGYDAADDFAERQNALLRGETIAEG